MSIHIDFSLNKISPSIEKNVIKLINKNAPECFNSISSSELKNIKNKLNISEPLINSIRASYIRNKMIKSHYKINDNIKKIIKDYDNKQNILQLSKKYDASTLNILRYVFKNKYPKTNIKEILNNPIKYINTYDAEQFNIALHNDIYAVINNNEQLKNSIKFEDKIEDYLKLKKIKYQTQNDLVKIQTEKYGKPISTPDFLILSDLYINKHKIHWIDAKNFYGMNISFVKQSINKQIQKYINNYGFGCIIFSLNANEILQFDNVLIIGYDDLK